LRQAIEGNFETFFRGAQFKAVDEAGDAAMDMASEGAAIVDEICVELAQSKGYEEFKRGFNMVAKPLDVVLEYAQKLADTNSIAETVQACGLHTLTGLYQSMTPFLGLVKGGAGAVSSIYKGVDDVRSASRSIEATPIVNTGAPRQALQAVSGLLDRRANDQFATGAIKAVETIVNSALTASGVGVVASGGVSIAGRIGALSVVIRRRGIEFKEMKEGKQALLRPRELSPEVFGKCPLLGCYLLTGSETAAIVVSALGRGRPAPGWLDQVEANKRFLDPMLDKAKSFVTDSVWRLEGPNISSKAWTVDGRPWVERFWISRYGASGKMYRAIQKGKSVAEVKSKVGDAYAKVSEPLAALVKYDLQQLAALKSQAAPA
jgi:hypothetical protein